MMNTMSSNAIRATVRTMAALSLCLVFGLARGQVDADPPDRAARLSLIRGDVSLQPAGEEEWTTAILNRPLTTGDRLWTDQAARAEIQVGQAAVRLGSNTGFSFLNVDDDTIQMRLTAGVINVRVRALTDEQIEIDTPNLALSLLRPGNYRVEVNGDGDTTVVKVSEGEAEASGGERTEVVRAGEAATFTGTEQLATHFGALGAPDEFDDWSLERDQRSASSQAAQYVAPDVTGSEDLDANGTWSTDDEYGNVWTPTRVSVDWSPYRYGRWVWVSPWGWTWIDDAPWGYAPFHYGRWAHVRNRWCWVPGPRHVRAVYAPAVVGWVGGGGVAWFPLGPREVYVPGRRFSHRYVERVNVTNTVIINRTHITEIYNNRARNVPYRNRVAGAVTAVTRNAFTSAQRTGDHRVRIDDRELTRTRGAAVAPQIQPVRESRLGVSEAVRRNVRVPPQTVANRQVIVKREPPPSAAHFARNRGHADAVREQAGRSARPEDRVDRGEATNRGRPGNTNDANSRSDAIRGGAQAAERDRVRAARNARAAQDARDNRPPQDRPRTDGPPRTDRPQVETAREARRAQPDPRNSPDQPQPRPLQERLQQERQRNESRPAELQQREQRDLRQQQVQRQQLEQRQQQGREHAMRQREQAQQQAAAQQTQQRQRNAERPQVERPQVERQNRPEPAKPAENKPQPRQQQNRGRERPQQDDR